MEGLGLAPSVVGLVQLNFENICSLSGASFARPPEAFILEHLRQATDVASVQGSVGVRPLDVFVEFVY